ncbi:hypothetical protein MTR67_040084 [Solanum verrucosum]|uniref:Uncharacterized protein n=1 Tax=Solanum verrucosum TaxID=315347 RepID=A0AAF0ZRT3_SOLVR|nr:hypothetical protein MTR67_040084 [Solanum verrucosum]
MTMVAYETKFHALSHYATQLVNTDKERIRLFVKGLNSELKILYVHMTSARKSFNELTGFVNKVERVRQVRQTKIFTKRFENVVNYSGLTTVFDSGGQGASYASTNMPSLDHIYFNCGDPGQFKRECTHKQMVGQVRQQAREVVPLGRGNNGRGHSQDGREVIREVVKAGEMVMQGEERHTPEDRFPITITELSVMLLRADQRLRH